MFDAPFIHSDVVSLLKESYQHSFAPRRSALYQWQSGKQRGLCADENAKLSDRHPSPGDVTFFIATLLCTVDENSDQAD